VCLSLFPKNSNPKSSVSCDRAGECVLTVPCMASLDQVYICQSFSTGVPQDKLRRKWLMEQYQSDELASLSSPVVT
jgi:hypothetical protein